MVLQAAHEGTVDRAVPRGLGDVINGGHPLYACASPGCRLTGKREGLFKSWETRERDRENRMGVKQEEARGVPQRAGITVGAHSYLE